MKKLRKEFDKLKEAEQKGTLTEKQQRRLDVLYDELYS